MHDKFSQIEDKLSKLAESFSRTQGASTQQDQAGSSRPGQGDSVGERIQPMNRK